MSLPNPDMETHERLMEEPYLGPSIISAVVACMIGALGPDDAAATLRRWADEIQASGLGREKQ